MYNEVLAILVGEAWLFRCAELFKYALLVFVVLHLFVVLYEERTLESRFGESYRAESLVRATLGFYGPGVPREHRKQQLISATTTTCRGGREMRPKG
jgi:hypothetical protein